MKQISFPLSRHECITLQGNYSSTAGDIELLGRLTGLPLEEKSQCAPEVVWEPCGKPVPPDSVVVYRTKTVRMVYCDNDHSFHLYLLNDSQLHRNVYGVFLWHLSILCAAVAAILRGKKVLIVHCSMLEKASRALLLMGESGIGKSTSMRRWQASGGRGVSDDMVLLEYAEDDRILVHHMPTWSACRVGLENLYYPFEVPLELASVLAVTRGKDAEVVDKVSYAEFFAQIYRCCFYHYLFVAGELPEPEKKLLTSAVREWAEVIAGRFPHRALFAHLDGNISKSLEGIL